MLEPISVTLGFCGLGFAALGAYARQGSAVSAEAEQARRTAFALVESVEKSQALFGEKRTALSTLIGLATECGYPDWDGAGAEALDAAAVQTARDFIRALPEGVLLPEFAPEPDGSVALDWTVSKHRRLTLSVGRTDRLAYAWLDGTDKGHGVAHFDGSVVPRRVLDTIRSIVGHASPSVWPA